MLPSLAERWSEDLGLDYVISGCNTRFPFEKGMVFTFDFLDFADKVAGNRIIKDAWGNEVDLSNVELILTTSMVKLWDSYKSCDDYLANCQENHYQFAVTKECPEELESQRLLNYQFIQSYDLSDEDIDELISPTIQEIHNVLHLDWRYAVMFLCGADINPNKIEDMGASFAKAIMIDPRVLDDRFVQSKILKMINKRIKRSKIGVVNVHGNYSIVCGDPYALCQNMFGLDVTGLLKAGEIYNKYWFDTDADKVACFRAPMTCHNNIAKLSVCRSDDAAYWYQHMTTCTLLNAWDTTCARLNGMDKDGDLVMLTDNPVLLRKYRYEPTLMCAQRRAEKIIPTEEDFVTANIASFGDEIGSVTNRITSMFEVASAFDPESEEYSELMYRIKCGQLYQQNSMKIRGAWW